jgi:uncharacterized protein (TIGR02145 family)
VEYTPATEACCGSNKYTIATQFCLGTTVTPLCGGKEFTASEFCSGTDVLNKCGGSDYTPSTHFCLGTTVTPLCGGKTFTASEFCFDDAIIDKCGGAEYDPGTHYCHEGQAHTCGNLPLNPSTHYCHTDGEQYSCGSKPFNPDNQFCYEDSEIGEYCGAREDVYNPVLYECKPSLNRNGIYLKTPVSYEGQDYEAVLIGNQTWLARNLNYAVSGSKCVGASGSSGTLSDDNNARCDTYGRLYNWSTATALDPTSCQTTSCSSLIQSKHQGICPAGWHLPSDAEWTALTTYVGTAAAGTKLKAASGWNSNGNGTDDFGFSALPGGYGNSSGSFINVGTFGYWWSATESNASDAYSRGMYYSGATVDRYDNGKSSLYSVRCVQD